MASPRAALVPAIALLSACQAPAAAPDAPARIVDPTPESRATLARAVVEALNGAQALLADDALTTSSELVIERTMPRDLNGRSLDGRELDRPTHFRLVLSGSQCVLVREADGRRWVLTATRCAPE